MINYSRFFRFLHFYILHFTCFYRCKRVLSFYRKITNPDEQQVPGEADKSADAMRMEIERMRLLTEMITKLMREPIEATAERRAPC